MRLAVVVVAFSLAFAAPAFAISPADETEILNAVRVFTAPGVQHAASAWRIVRFLRAHEPPQVTIESLTLYPDVVELAAVILSKLANLPQAPDRCVLLVAQPTGRPVWQNPPGPGLALSNGVRGEA